jgi:hypothetical protein
MGTLSKRPLRDFGVDIKERIEGFRSSVGGKLDHLHDRAAVEMHNAGALWFGVAGAAFVGSLALKLLGRGQASLFVGQLVPTFLVIGLYARLKQQRAVV